MNPRVKAARQRSAATSEAAAPTLVEPVGDRMERIDAARQIVLDFLWRLNGGTVPGCFDFRSSDLRPRAHQRLRHLDMALHRQMLADDERLVGAMVAFENSSRTRRNAESFAVPVKDGAATNIA